MKDRRLGKIIVSGYFVHEDTEVLAEVFTKIKAVTVQLEHHFDTDIFEYMLYSPLFDVCPMGEVAPKYALDVTTERDVEGNTISFDVKVKRLARDYIQPYNPTTMEMMLANTLK